MKPIVIKDYSIIAEASTFALYKFEMLVDRFNSIQSAINYIRGNLS